MWDKLALPNGRRLVSPSAEGHFTPPTKKGEVMFVITFSDLCQFSLVIIGIIGLLLQSRKKK